MRVATTILMTLFAPAVLGAQEIRAGGSASAAAAVETDRSTTAVEATGDASADARIQQAFDRAEAESVTTAGLESRVRMGIARGASAARIAAAVEQRVDALIASRNALRASGHARSETMIELGADAIESGARGSQVAEVAADFGGEAAPRALAVLGQLAAEGRIGANALASVRSAFDASVAGAGSASAASGNVAAGASAATSATAGIGGAAAGAGGTVSGAAGAVLPR